MRTLVELDRNMNGRKGGDECKKDKPDSYWLNLESGGTVVRGVMRV